MAGDQFESTHLSAQQAELLYLCKQGPIKGLLGGTIPMTWHAMFLASQIGITF